jgi:DeoR/GlpR family transcriptional regulator of sugar metabolism
MNLKPGSSDNTLFLPQEERRLAILEILKDEGFVRVNMLSSKLGVSEVTIRRDLDEMELERLVERTHGGASLSRHLRSEPGFEARYRENFKEKRRIAQAAAALVENGETIFLSSGSTALHFLHELVEKKITVVTSNAEAVAEVGASEIKLTLTGGEYRHLSRSFIGPVAVNTISRFVASKTFIGVDGISLEFGMTSFTIERAEIVHKMVAHTSGKLVVLADHTKLGRVGDCQVATLERCDTLVIDGPIPAEYQRGLADRGIEVIIV